MRHLKAHRKLGRTTAHRMSMLRNLATSLINAHDERIITTLPKAKELRPFVERVITLSRRAQTLEGDERDVQAVHLRRQAASFFHSGNRQQAASAGRRGQQRAPRTAGVLALKRLFDELGERFKDRPGGYTRIIKLGHRDGDNAELAIIELVDNPRERASLESSKKKAATTGKKKTAKASESKAAEGGRRAGKKADKTFEKEETTKARGRGKEKRDEQTEDQKPTGGRRAKKTESTAAEKDTD
jgi:large subunit ribosomal protein L17